MPSHNLVCAINNNGKITADISFIIAEIITNKQSKLNYSVNKKDKAYLSTYNYIAETTYIAEQFE